MLLASFFCSPHNFFDNHGIQPLLLFSLHAINCKILFTRPPHQIFNLCGPQSPSHVQKDSFIDGRSFASTAPYHIIGWDLLMSTYMVEGQTIICGLLVSQAPLLLFIPPLYFSTLINTPQLNILFQCLLYLFLKMYFNKLLSQWTHYGIHCSQNISEIIFPIPPPSSIKVYNSNHPSDLLALYTQGDVYHTKLQVFLVPRNILSNSFVYPFHLTIKNLCGSFCCDILEENSHNLHNTC